MQEIFEKIIERLQEERKKYNGCQPSGVYMLEANRKSIEIVKRIAAEYNNGWIPCSERLPDRQEYLANDGKFIVTDGNRRYQSIFDIYSGKFKTMHNVSPVGTVWKKIKVLSHGSHCQSHISRKESESMNERYLFKAKRMDNGEWIDGNLLYSKKDYYISTKPFQCVNSYSSKYGQSYGFEGFVLVDKNTICQCTGIRDKNGELIWENDIVRRKIADIEEVIGVIKWINVGFTGFMMEVKNKGGKKHFYPVGCGTFDDDTNERCNDEVIGNILDNMELLER